jgi:glycosyltransferase involved in cell wall biosynthesis
VTLASDTEKESIVEVRGPQVGGGALERSAGQATHGTQGDREDQLDLTVIIPCYNEEAAIIDTLAKVEVALRQLQLPAGVEILAINDGSVDETGARLIEARARNPAVRVLEREKNRGYGAAIKYGLRRARGRLVAILDADGTYPVDRLPELVDRVRDEDVDMVIGARTSDDVTYPFARKIPKWFFRGYSEWLSGSRIPDFNSGLRVFRRQMALRFINYLPDGFSLTATITLASLINGCELRFVPINYYARTGKSKIQPIRDTLRFAQLLLRTGMYFSPLRLLSPLLLLLVTAATLALGYDLFIERNLTDKTILLFGVAINAGILALLADMIHKRIEI